MLFHPSVTVLLFSRREDEAAYLLERLRGMYVRLPPYFKVRKVVKSNTEMWQLSNGSVAYGFPTTAGDSYTASLAIVDEADLVPDLDALMKAVKPTIDGGGKMILLSRSNKTIPDSPFKQMYRAARAGTSPWVSVFLPWYVRPGRDSAWYEEQKRDVLGRTGSLDDLHEQYPATDEEALSARELDKRLPPQWLSQCHVPIPEIDDPPIGIPGMRVYQLPHWQRKYVIGADPAEGNPTSDDSSLHVLDDLGAEVACLADKIETTTFAEYIVQIARWYNGAEVLVERNNHGHAVIGHIAETSLETHLLEGWDGKLGWFSSTRGKALMWAAVADATRDKVVTIRSGETYNQLLSIEGATLKAPKGMHDDRAVSFGLATLVTVGEPNEAFSVQYAI
jgi:hypothetical protein